MSIIDIPDPELPEWLKILNTYDPKHYIPGKKVTAEEWNTLFLASVNQGNYLADTMDILIKTYLPDAYISKSNFDEYAANLEESLQGLRDADIALRGTVDVAVANANQANITSQVAEANSALAVHLSDEALGIARTVKRNSELAVETSNRAETVANSTKQQSQTAEDQSSAALMTSNTAKEIAQDAKDIAEGIDNKATEALDLSRTFKPVAEAAYTSSNQAVTDSTNALDKSITALDNSREAMKDASEAQSDAKSALEFANEALSKINQAIKGVTVSIITDTSNALDTLYLTKNLDDTRENSALVTATIKSKFDEHANTINQLSESTQTAVENLQHNIDVLETNVGSSISTLESNINTTIETLQGDIQTLGANTQTALEDLKDYTDATFLPLTGGALTGNLTVGGNLTVSGVATTVNSTTLAVKDKLIEIAKDNEVALTTPAGLVVPKYDGTNAGALVFDASGTAYVGDVTLDSNANIDVNNSDLQPLATREKTPTDGGFAKWDATTFKFVTDTDVASNTRVDSIEEVLSDKVSNATLRNAIQNNLVIPEDMKLQGTYNQYIWEPFTFKAGPGVNLRALGNRSGFWTDGTDLYYSANINDEQCNYVLDRSTYTWYIKTWNGLTPSWGDNVWTDLDGSVYYTANSTTYKLDKATSTWSYKAWTGYNPASGAGIWNDGHVVYYSAFNTQYVKYGGNEWVENTDTSFRGLYGYYVWRIGTDIYYSDSNTQKVFDKTSRTWSDKIWNTGFTTISKDYIWSDGINLLYSDTGVYDRASKNWINISDIVDHNIAFYPRYIFTDGSNIFHTNGIRAYILRTKNLNLGVLEANITELKTNVTELKQTLALPIGTIIQGALPLNSAGLHLLDGSIISQTGIYAQFTTYLKSIYPSGDYTATQYESDLATYGQCGHFVIDNTNNTIRLPKITEFIASSNGGKTIGLAELDMFKSHTHIQNAHSHSIYRAGDGGYNWDGSGLAGSPRNNYADNVSSGSTTATNQNTGGEETRPKNIRYPYYIVLANTAQTNVMVDINNVVSELNLKVDKANIPTFSLNGTVLTITLPTGV